ncbi:hypothetical protein [Mesorhizobium sp. 10J20-29]
MSANILGAAWLGFGTLIGWFLLHKTKLLDRAPMNFGLTADDLRQNFKYLVAAAVCAGAVVGWNGGSILFGADK